MGVILLRSIGQLVTNCVEPGNADSPVTAVGELGVIDHAAVLVDVPEDTGPGGSHGAGGIPLNEARTLWVGSERNLPDAGPSKVVDLGGRALIPGFVDSHTHLVFGGERGDEFESRMAGVPYDGGGIARTVHATRVADDETLTRATSRLVSEARAQGTTTLEIKSGYGLNIATETRLVSIARKFTPEVTFLGGHAVPLEYRGGQGAWGSRDDYVRLVCGPMLDAVANTGAARWSDVFCEPHSPFAFDGDETRAMLESAQRKGLGLRVHGAQLGEGPGPLIACELGAASVDHCTFLTDRDIEALAATWQDGADDDGANGTVATYLPAVEFSTKQPYPNMRRAIDAGAQVALATDCNPGTCFSDSMPFAIAVAVREMGLGVAEAVWAATAGGALALRRNDIGVIRPGARADYAVLDAPGYSHIAYRPGVPIAHAWNPFDRPLATDSRTGLTSLE